MATGTHLANWTGPEVIAECRAAHNAYRAARTDTYRAYFAANPHLKAEDHAYTATNLAAALPDKWSGLAELLPVSERHRHHLSGNSSQVLALGLLGVAAKRDPTLAWLWNALGPLPPAQSDLPAWRFERKLGPNVLAEEPRQTSIDFYVDDPAALLCIEAKWTEDGIGKCGCAGGGGNPAAGECTEKVLERKAYWRAAYDVFHLPEREAGQPCPLSFTYQAVRNVAAALAIARPGQEAVFGLVYDADNPYFGTCGRWPGWPAALRATLDDAHPGLRFAAVSWQQLLPLLPLDDSSRAWASEMHGLRHAVQ